MLGQLFKSFIPGKAATVGAKAAPKFEIPQTLPNIASPTAGPVLQAAGVTASPEIAQATPAHYLNHALNEDPNAAAATQFMAHGMKPEPALRWATDSCDAVADKLSPADKEALAAAKRFQAQPTPYNQKLTALQAERAGYKGPGAWAALAASAYPAPGDVARVATPSTPAAPGLFPKAIAGAVNLAALSASGGGPAAASAPVATTPLAQKTAADVATTVAPTAAEKIQAVQSMKPFLDRGLQLAAGK